MNVELGFIPFTRIPTPFASMALSTTDVFCAIDSAKSFPLKNEFLTNPNDNSLIAISLFVNVQLSTVKLEQPYNPLPLLSKTQFVIVPATPLIVFKFPEKLQLFIDTAE